MSPISVPPSLLEDIKSQAAKFPSVRLIEDGASLGFSFVGEADAPGVEAAERSARSSEMDG